MFSDAGGFITSKTESVDTSRPTSASLKMDLDVEGRAGDSAAPKRSLIGDLTALILIPPTTVGTKSQKVLGVTDQ